MKRSSSFIGRPAGPRAALAICALTVVFGFVGCAGGSAGGRGADLPSKYAELKVGELRAMAASDPAKTLEAVASMIASEPAVLEARGVSISDLQSIAAESLASIESAYARSVESGDFRLALSCLDDLSAAFDDSFIAEQFSESAVRIAEDAQALRSDILAREAESFYARGTAAPAFCLYLQALRHEDGGRRGAAELSEWMKRAMAAKDRGAAARFLEAAATRGAPAPDGIGEYIASRDSIAAMRKGVVTIRVDRGIKIEQGVGSPDRGLGSGFFIDSRGYILTNYHVISSEVDPEYEGYSRITVKLADSSDDRIPAKVVGWDRLLDLALLKVDVRPGYVFSLLSSHVPEPGQRVIAFGSPLGLVDTVTSGIISASGRRIVGIQTGDTLQVDVAINPGNSGGPLVDEAGNTVGIAFAGFSQYQGLNFAIPASWAASVLPALFRGGEVKRAWLGVAIAEKKPGVESDEGLEIVYRHPSVIEGLEEGDRLLALGGSHPSTIQEAQALLVGREAKSLICIEIEGRSGRRTRLRYLAERPYAPFESAVKLDRKEQLFPALFGMSVKRLPSTLLEPDNFSISRVWPGTVADESGLSENDPISLKRFVVDTKSRVAYIQIYVKKRKAGFLESVIQIPASLDSPDFL
jgi:S1-C subfamily serine protease